MELRQIYQRIERRLEELDLSPRAASLKAHLSPDAIRNIERALKKGDIHRGVNSGTIVALSQALEVTPEWLFTGHGDVARQTIQLVGKIGAGAQIDLLNNDDLDTEVEAPPNCTEDTIAVEVSGESMFPAYEEGTLLYYSQNVPPAELVNRRCVVKLADGRIFVKVLRQGAQGLWNLESVNPATPTMVDQTVEWVAKIDWVKPR